MSGQPQCSVSVGCSQQEKCRTVTIVLVTDNVLTAHRCEHCLGGLVFGDRFWNLRQPDCELVATAVLLDYPQLVIPTVRRDRVDATQRSVRELAAGRVAFAENRSALLERSVESARRS